LNPKPAGCAACTTSLMTLMLARKADLKLEPLSLESFFREITKTMMISLRENGIELKTEHHQLFVQAVNLS
jgi:hypothetical protein